MKWLAVLTHLQKDPLMAVQTSVNITKERRKVSGAGRGFESWSMMP